MWVETSVGSAYVPDPLTFSIIQELPDSQFPEFFQAYAALTGFISAQRLGKIAFKLLLRREAQMFSARALGRGNPLSYTTFPFVPFHVFDLPESINYARAVQFSWSARSHPLSREHLRAVHRRLLPFEEHAGRFRALETGLGPRGCRLQDATILLTPSEYVDSCLRDIRAFSLAVPKTHRLAACAMLHAQLIAIHPFSDGNGRLARAILPAIIKRIGLGEAPCLFAGEELSTAWAEYYRRIESLERYGEATAWIVFFVELLTKQLSASLAFSSTCHGLRNGLILLFSQSRRNPIGCNRLADAVILSPTLTLSAVACHLRISRSAAGKFMRHIEGRYGARMIVESEDPVYQFGDVYEGLLM